MRARREAGLPEGCVTLVKDTSHETAEEMMGLTGLIDVLIPRGGKRLIHSVVDNARVPVIQTGDGVCHVYVDEAANIEMAVDIVINSKVSRPSVCNAMETMLVHSAIAPRFLPICMDALSERGVELRCCERTLEICPEYKLATPEDWDTEYNDLILSVRIVCTVWDAAIHHINIHGTRHSEAIVTSELRNREIVSGQGGCGGSVRQCSLHALYRWRRVRLRRGDWHKTIRSCTRAARWDCANLLRTNT